LNEAAGAADATRDRSAAIGFARRVLVGLARSYKMQL